MNKNKGFNLLTVILIIICTSIISAFTTGVILNNNYKSENGLSYSEIANDNALSEFLNVYSIIVSQFYDEVDTTGMLNAGIEEMNKYEGNDPSEMLSLATDKMLEYLGDDYTILLNDEESDTLDDRLSGTYEGIGITISENEVMSVLLDSPAEKAGILPGDFIIKIEDDEITDTIIPLIGYLIQNNERDDVNITILRGEEELTLNVEKTTLGSSVSSVMIEDTDIGYININVFSTDLISYFKDAYNNLIEEGMEKLILDLRYNTGGYLEEAVNLSSFFLKEGSIIYGIENKDEKEMIRDLTSEYKEIEIVILINEESASASEILTAALVDSYGATTVGVQSYGKGKIQQKVSSSSDFIIKYTSDKWLTPKGICIDGIGITPNYIIENEYIYDEEGKITELIDKQLDNAISILKGE